MPGFQFELSQLVNVPGKDQQGRVSARMEYPIKLSVYEVSWLDECCEQCAGLFTTDEMLAAQKPKPDTVGSVKVEITADTAQFEADIDRATEKAKGLEAAADAAAASISRLPPNVLNLRNRRPASKRKSRR